MPQSVKANYTKVYTVLFTLLTATGFALRIYQHFFLGRPLIDDEAHIALNFIDSNFFEMFVPLQHFQSAPILFLLSEELFTSVFGFGEIALRTFPFLVAFITYPLFYFFVRDMTGNRLTAIVAYTLLTFNPFIIYYSSMVKPYAIEVAAYIVLGYIVFSTHDYVARKREKLLIIWGIICMFLANTAMVILGCIVVYRFIKVWVAKKNADADYAALKVKNKRLYIRWGIAFAASVILNIIINPYADNMRSVWTSTFIPVNVFSTEFTDFMRVRLDEFFFSGMFFFYNANYSKYLLAAILLLGVIYIAVKKNYIWFCWVLLPLIAHAGMSWVQLYPFYYRFIMYLMPAIMILIAISISQIAAFIGRQTHVLVSGVFIALMGLFLLMPAVNKIPYGDNNILPCLDFINQHPAEAKVFTTTPTTLYEYYLHRGYVHNQNRAESKWNISTEEYYQHISEEANPYLLLLSNYNYDGYAEIIRSLEERNMVIDSMSGNEYKVMYLQPVTHDNN